MTARLLTPQTKAARGALCAKELLAPALLCCLLTCKNPRCKLLLYLWSGAFGRLLEVLQS